MRNKDRIDAFGIELERIWAEFFPDWRFFQFMTNVMEWIQNEKGIDPYFIEEEKAITYIKEYAKNIKNY